MPNPIINRRTGGAIIPPTQGQLLASAWADQVVTNGGVRPGATSIAAAGNFLDGLMTDLIYSKMIAINIFAPDNLIASITPLIKTAGNTPWTNTNFVLGNLSANGLSSASSGFLKTGVNPNVVYASANDAGFTFYANTAGSAPKMRMLSIDGSNAAGLYCDASAANSGAYGIWNQSPAIGGLATNIYFFFSNNRTASNASAIYLANGSLGFTTLQASAGAPGTRPNLDVWVFTWNFNGSPSQTLDAGGLTTCSFAAIHNGLSSAEANLFFNRVQTLRQTLGGGYT